MAPEAGPEPEEEAASGQKQASESTIMPDRNRPQISSVRVSQGVRVGKARALPPVLMSKQMP